MTYILVQHLSCQNHRTVSSIITFAQRIPYQANYRTGHGGVIQENGPRVLVISETYVSHLKGCFS